MRIRDICVACGKRFDPAEDRQAEVRSNTRQYLDRSFPFWQCQGCGTIHCMEVFDPAVLYKNYEQHRERLTFETWIACGWRALRMRQLGLSASDVILDFGCGSGVFAEFLKRVGYRNVQGYDPYSPDPRLRRRPTGPFTFVMANDVLEHFEDPATLLAEVSGCLGRGGRLVIGTPDAAALDLRQSAEQKHYFHAPYHFHLYPEAAIVGMAKKVRLKAVRTIHRSVGEAPFIFGMNYAYGERLVDNLDGAVDVLLDNVPFGIRFGPRQVINGVFGYFYSGGKSLNILFEIESDEPLRRPFE